MGVLLIYVNCCLCVIIFILVMMDDSIVSESKSQDLEVGEKLIIKLFYPNANKKITYLVTPSNNL